MEQGPHIATELLQLIVDELGAEAETLPSSSEAFQALLSFSLAGPLARLLCEKHIFATLTFDQKCCPTSNAFSESASTHLQATIELFNANPRLASYVRYLQISFHRAFPSYVPANPKDPSPWNQAQTSEKYAEAMLPQVLSQVLNVVSFSFDGCGSRSHCSHPAPPLPSEQ